MWFMTIWRLKGLKGYSPFVKDAASHCNCSYHGTAVYYRKSILNGYPCAQNVNGLEFTIMKTFQYAE